MISGRVSGWGWVLHVALAAALLQGAAHGQGSATPVPQLDLKQFASRWYEVERLPNKQEKQCDRDAMLLYSLRDKPGKFEVVQSCLLKDGTAKTRNFVGKVADKSGSGRLKVTYTWPFTHKYWVMGLGPEYAWMLVGSPDHKTLWILSHTPVLAPEMLAEARSRAAAQGFDVAKMVAPSQVGQRP